MSSRNRDNPSLFSRLWHIGIPVLIMGFLPVWMQARSDAWPQFRGPDGNGICTNNRIPIEWSTNRHLAWKIRIPGSGWSQPVIFENRIFLTTAVSDRPVRPKEYSSGTADLHTLSGDKAAAPETTITWKVLAVDLQDGTVQWTSTVACGKPKYPIHPSNSYASETPMVDDRRVYAWFGALGTVAAFDHAGRLLWRRDLGVFRHQQNFGSGSSPRLHQGLLYIQCFNEEQAFLVCLDARDGREHWRTSRDRPGTAWTTPLLWHNTGRTELIVCGQQLITSHDPQTGRELWRGNGFEMAGPASVTADNNRLYLGFKSALKKTKLYALKAGADGDQSTLESSKAFQCEAWALVGAAPGMASPVVADDCVYVASDAFVGCYDAASGHEHYQKRIPGFRCIVASPIVVDQHVFFMDESGSAVVLQTGPAGEIIGRSKLDDIFWASPAVAHNALVLRGVDYLYCIRE